MGQCGCGEIVPEAVFRLGKTYIIINRYPGCHYCSEPPSVDMLFFDEQGYRDFGQDFPPMVIWPDGYGGNDGTGGNTGRGNLRGYTQFGFPSSDDLALAADRLEEEGQHELFEAYGSVADYLRDNGLRLMQTAMRISDERRKRNEQP